MPPARRRVTALASALLAMAALVSLPGAQRVQAADREAPDGYAEGRLLERPAGAMAAQARRARLHRRLEQRRQMARAQAHARMPNTMYASTPSPPGAIPSWHPVLVGPDAEGARPGPASPAPASPQTSGSGTHLIPLFASAADPLGRQGFARVINRSDEAGEVHIDAFDDEGTPRGPLTLTIGANETVHFNSEDLERGNSGKGLEGGTGLGEGNWRLELTSPLDLDVLAYMRTEDGFLTSLHDLVPRTESGHRVVTFNPGRNTNQMSVLRVMNPGDEPAEVAIEGIDGKGESPGEAVRVTVPSGSSRMLRAAELESGGTGFTGALGTGSSKWQLVVSSEQAVEVMSLLSSPTGHLTNLSTVPDNVEPGEDGVTVAHAIPLFPAMARWEGDGYQGFARVINRTGEEGEVRIDAWDDEGTHAGPVTLTIGANETVHFNSDDLEAGAPDKGLSGSIEAGSGDWRLNLSSSLDLDVLAYIRTQDGFLTSIHDAVPRTEAGHRVAIFNPGRNANQESVLRVMNPGDEPAEVSIEGIDGKGESTGEVVRLTVPSGASRTLSARELESGGVGFTGSLGTGSGKWQLVVRSEQAVEVMSLLSSPSGHLTNLSTAPDSRVMPGETAADVFAEFISEPVVQSKCVNCHVKGGQAGATRLLFVPSSTPDHEAYNLGVFEDFLAKQEGGADYVLNKIQGVGHGGGVQVAAGTPEYGDMERFLRLLGEEVSSTPLTPQTLFDTVTMAPTRKTLRRAALIFAGRIPTDAEYAAAQGSADALRATIRGFMTGPEFHEFLLRGANDRLLTDRNIGHILNAFGYFVDFTNENHRRAKAALTSGTVRALRDYEEWSVSVQYGARRAPLELIAHVVENDLPYTEILTADYIMANPVAAGAYGAPTHHFDDSEDIHEFKPSSIESYYRHGVGTEIEYDPVVDVNRVINPGPLITDYPHAGILNTKVFLQRYPTTATNRNRARSRWTYYHFLGVDVEKSASRTTDPVALADTNNPTLRNPACTVCHRVLDPVAGAFQNYGDAGLYKDQWLGLDSLDHFYKVAGKERKIRAESWEDREALFWPVFLTAGVQTLRVFYANDYYDPDTGDDGWVFLDRLRVTDAGGRTLASHEFEDLGPPVLSPGSDSGCGHQGYDPAGRNDHVGLFNGGIECAFFIDVVVPRDGVYEVEIVAWMNGRHELYGEDGFAKLAVAANAYQEGDTWYRDMRAPGFNGELALNSDNSVQWLAERIVADERFPEAAVKFWWPAIMGSEVAEPPEDEGDADFEGLLVAANAQGAEVTRLANGFRRGFRGRSPYNLKDLLVEIVLSKWFRADTVEDAHPVRRIALRDAGARRLLIPEELDRKTAAITGFKWGRQARISHAYRGDYTRLTGDFRLLYGGIDSDGVTERTRDITSVMAGVAKRHAVQVSCPIVMRELYLVPEAERRLFAGIDRFVTPGLERGSAGENVIRSQLVDLHDKLLGVEVTPHSPDVEAAYRIFLNAMERRRAANDTWFNWYECDSHFDLTLFEGIVDDVVVERTHEDGWRDYGFDWDRLGPFLDGVDWSDPHHTAQAWVVVLAYLLMDYRYLYL